MNLRSNGPSDYRAVTIIEYVNVAHSIGSETLFKITGTCGQGPIVPLICPSLPFFFLNHFFFMYTTCCNFLCITVWHIYKKKPIKQQFLSILGFWHMHKVLKVFFFETFWAIVYFINAWCNALSEYKYKLEFALGIIQSRRSGCAIVLFLATRYFPCRIR